MNTALWRKVAGNSESVVVLVGHMAELSRPLTAFLRLKSAVKLHPGEEKLWWSTLPLERREGSSG